MDIIEAARKRFQFEHDLNYIAVLNAVGPMYIKNYRYKDVFKENKAKKEITEEEREDMRRMLEDW